MGEKRFYGWTALIGAMLVYFSFCGCIYYSYGVFLPVMCADLSWSRATLSSPLTVYLLIGGFLGPIVGLSISRFGARKNIIIGNLIAGLGLTGMFLVKEVWQVYFFFSLVVAAAHSFGGFIPATTIATNWFIKRRSLAIGMVIASGGVAGLFFPIFISWLIAVVGWRLSWVVLGGIFILLASVFAGVLVRNKPEDIGQVPDGEFAEATVEGSERRSAVSRVYQTTVNWEAADALRTRSLWMILAFTAANQFTLNVLASHQVAYLRDIGFTPIIAAAGLSLLVGISTLGKLLGGALGTRFEGRHLATVFLTGLAVGIVVLMNVKTVPLIYLSSVISGISYGGMLVFQPAMLGAYYGRANYQQIIGWTTLVSTLVSALGPLLAGSIYDATGSYFLAFLVALALIGVGFVCALLAVPPKIRVGIVSIESETNHRD